RNLSILGRLPSRGEFASPCNRVLCAGNSLLARGNPEPERRAAIGRKTIRIHDCAFDSIPAGGRTLVSIRLWQRKSAVSALRFGTYAAHQRRGTSAFFKQARTRTGKFCLSGSAAVFRAPSGSALERARAGRGATRLHCAADYAHTTGAAVMKSFARKKEEKSR